MRLTPSSAAGAPVTAERPSPTLSIGALVAQGRLGAAEQLCAVLSKRGVSPDLAPAVLLLAKACDAAGRRSAAGNLLAKLAGSAPSPEDLEAAHMARALGRPYTAALLFGKAHREMPLADEHRLAMALATLAAAEQMRLPRGRQGAWSQHEEWLVRAEVLLETVAMSSDVTASIRARAWTGLARVLRLQRASAMRIEEALARAAALHIGLAGEVR